MKCCPNCIGDRGLRKSIFPTLTTENGQCDYCQSENVFIVEPRRLGDVFGPLVNIYEQSEGGRLLVQWFREDWGLFKHDRFIDDFRASSLLAEILDDGDIVRRPFAPSPTYATDRLPKWEKLRDELMFGNRFFPETELDESGLASLLSYLIADDEDLPTQWYRARLMRQDNPYAIEEMGAPPKKLATHGRANPAGIPYLYLGSTRKTAVAEIRPHTGEVACVADFSTPAGLKVIDLRDPLTAVSPFVLGDEQQIGYMRADIPFLARLGDELTRPVVPQSAAFDYVPSQYLCEFIKKCGYAGVMYRSSVGNGVNLALFNPEVARPGSVRQHTISQVTVEIDD
jgi:RES domain